MKKWTRANYLPCMPLGEDGKRVTESKEHIELSRRAAREGMVLLKNNGCLPLKKGTSLAIFGTAQADYVKGGGGSGDVAVSYTRNIYDGFKEKEKEGKVKVFDKLSMFYSDEVKKQYSEGAEIGRTREVEIPEELLAEAKSFADAALITICRFSYEGDDRKSQKGDFYLSDEEQKMVDTVCADFENVFVVLDVGGMIDTMWFKDNDKISSAILAWNAGMEGGLAIADIICGDETPSGKLVDTFAKSFYDYPSSETFSESDEYVKYYEDIYVGYRYFETIEGADKKVNYPFGFGLSYTDFDINGISASDDGEKITVTAKVTNIGKVSGKEVVQVYFSAPQGRLGKPKKQLAAFKKTKLLTPNESEIVKMSFKISDMASYDDLGKCAKSAYILEQGDYTVEVGSSVRNTKTADYQYTIKDEFIICSQLSEKLEPSRLEKRMLSDGSYEKLPLKNEKKFSYAKLAKNTAAAPEKKAMLIDVAEGRVSMDEFLAQFSISQLAELLGGKGDTGVSNTHGMGGMPEFGIPDITTADGPAGLRLLEDCDVCTTAWPCATLLACTWNPELLYEIGKHAAMEVKENNIGIWLAPGLNIHRNPLCGRNFEYFSEDPYLTGVMAAAEVNGIQSQHIAATPKHFACNNREAIRFDGDSVVSERAIREIYLKGFEICVKEAQPWIIMSSYNLVNGHHSSENYELLTGVLRNEWGYKGMVTTDWWTHGVHYLEVKAGNDIKMSFGYPESLVEAEYTGKLTREELELSAKRILEMILKID